MRQRSRDVSGLHGSGRLIGFCWQCINQGLALRMPRPVRISDAMPRDGWVQLFARDLAFKGTLNASTAFLRYFS